MRAKGPCDKIHWNSRTRNLRVCSTRDRYVKKSGELTSTYKHNDLEIPKKISTERNFQLAANVTDQEKVVNPSNLAASRIMGWQ